MFDENNSSALSYMSRPYSEAMAVRPEVTYTPYATSLEEQTGNVITFAQFEEGSILTETCNDTESGDESDSKSLMMKKQDMENLDFNEKSDHDIISTEMLEDICDGSHTHPNVNIREARYKIRDCIRQRKSEWKGVLKPMQSMGKGLPKVFSTVVKDISQELTPLGESRSEVSHIIPEPRKISDAL